MDFDTALIEGEVTIEAPEYYSDDSLKRDATVTVEKIESAEYHYEDVTLTCLFSFIQVKFSLYDCIDQENNTSLDIEIFLEVTQDFYGYAELFYQGDDFELCNLSLEGEGSYEGQRGRSRQHPSCSVAALLLSCLLCLVFN